MRRAALLLLLVLLAAGCGSALHGKTTMRTFPRETQRVGTLGQLRAGRQACTRLPRGILRTKPALRVYLRQHFPAYDIAVVLRGCLQALHR